MRTGAVIAAAGTPGGFRAYDKLENTDAGAMLRRMIYTFRRAGVEDVAVVTGYRAKETEKSLAKLGAAFLRCGDYENVQTQDAPVVIPVCGGRKGHPVLIDAGLTESIAEYKGERGLKGALDASGAEIFLLPVEDDGVILRARSEDHFEELAVTELQADIHPKVKLQLMRNEAFFGPGMMVLLKQIDVLGNVRDACEKAGMSYSKGWSLIRTAEKELGCPVVERSPGGKSGGMARVSSAGHRLMERYERLEREITEFAEKKYRERFDMDK